MNVVRLADIPWEDRRNVDNWPSRAGMYYENRKTELCIRLIDYPLGSVEPRHVHAGTHATTVLKGCAIVDGLTLGPLDVVLGPSNEPHGPLNYPDGCKLLSAFQGSYRHSEVQALSSEKHYRLIQSKDIPWVRCGEGVEAKTLVDHGAGRLLVEVMRFAPGVKHAPQFLAALVEFDLDSVQLLGLFALLRQRRVDVPFALGDGLFVQLDLLGPAIAIAEPRFQLPLALLQRALQPVETCQVVAMLLFPMGELLISIFHVGFAIV